MVSMRHDLPVPAGGTSESELAPDRRAAYRFRTVYRVAKVARDGDVGLWRVRNISDHGMMLLTGVPVTSGERLSVSLSDSVTLPAQVIWASEGRCGIAFERAIDCAHLLKTLVAERRASGYRPPRLPVETRALAYSEHGVRSVRLVNLSQHGIGFAYEGPLRAGMTMKLLLEQGSERRGVVRWARDGQAGLLLTEPFPCEALESAARF